MGTTGLAMEVVGVVMKIRFEREDTLWLFMIMILIYSPVILYSIGLFSSVWMQIVNSNGLHILSFSLTYSSSFNEHAVAPKEPDHSPCTTSENAIFNH